MDNQIIKFLRSKDFKFLNEIGQGGTGRTILVKDEFINEVFICKKYSPYYEDDSSLYYQYFKDEIKILHSLYHTNIVRVFNYYLYPERLTGYILMEFIEGQSINKYLLENPDKVEDVFIQMIEGFRYLEEKNILHRDIRPENILISENGIVKIIDFGFGKQVDFKSINKSISLNWRYATPKDFEEETYDHKTDIYFVGKLFEEILSDITNIEFRFNNLINNMIAYDPVNRIDSFFQIYREILSSENSQLEFLYSQKITYQNFADSLSNIIIKISDTADYKNQIDFIIREIENLHRNSMLEDSIQNNNKLTGIFINGNHYFNRKHRFKVGLMLSFLELLKSVSEDKKKIIINNIWERLDSIPRYIEEDDLPF